MSKYNKAPLNKVNKRLMKNFNRLKDYDVTLQFKPSIRTRVCWVILFAFLVSLMLIPGMCNIILKKSFFDNYMDYLEYLSTLISIIVAICIAMVQIHKHFLNMSVSMINSKFNDIIKSYRSVNIYSHELYDDVDIERKVSGYLQHKYIKKTVNDSKKLYCKIEQNILNSIVNVGFDNRLNKLLYNINSEFISLLVMSHVMIMKYLIDNNDFEKSYNDEDTALYTLNYLDKNSQKLVLILQKIQEHNNNDIEKVK